MSRTYTIQAAVDSVDVTSRLTGTIRIQAEESQAATALMTFLPASGTYEPEDWIGKAVTIDHVADPDGTPVTERIFTGFINLPELDEATGRLTLNCSDLIQEYFEELDDAGILAVLTGAKLSDEVFGQREDGWQRAQDALSTIRAEVHKSRVGAVTLAQWAAAATPDFAYTLSDYVDQTPKVDFAQRRELVNSITLTFEHRFARNKVREHDFSWRAGPNGGYTGWNSWCDWYFNSHDIPTTEMIESAARGTGWPIHGPIYYTHQKKAGSYYCNGGWVIWGGIAPDDGNPYDSAAQEAARQTSALRASWTGRKRISQNITETYTITVASAGSIALFGTIVGEDGASLDTKSDSNFESEQTTEIPDGFAQDIIGDWVKDETDTDAFENAVECLMQHADWRIAGSHRQTFVSWQTPLEPTIWLDHTAQLTAPTVSAKGKVFQIGHEIDIESGQATTSVRIAISRGGGGSSDSLTAPAQPDTSPTQGAPSSLTRVWNYIGGNGSVDDFDSLNTETRSYFSGNDSIITTVLPEKIYPIGFKAIGPDIEDEARQNVDAAQSDSYDVAVPDDTFSVVIP